MSESLSFPIAVELRYLDRVNYAVCHNGYSVCERCELTNSGDHDVTDLTVCLSGDLIEAVTAHVASVPAGTTVKVEAVHIKPDLDKLLQLTEAVTSTFTLTLWHGEEIVSETRYELKLLPVEQWLGASTIPELLAAYVTPNDDAVTTVLTRAAQHLKQLTGDAALDGYQTQDPNRVRAIVASIFLAIRELGLIYSNPPAGFETRGQRLRLARQVADQKLATCIDLSLLFASCLEAVELNTVLVLVNGHAMTGVWLVNDHCTQTACDDVAYLLKRCTEGIDEMVLVETTCVTQSGSVAFEQAANKAVELLRQPSTVLHCFVDVRACRLQGIRPIPLNRDTIVNEGIGHTLNPEAPRQVSILDMTGLETSKDLTRQQIWERKLLDFSMRNNLLNMKLGRRVIQFVGYGIDELENRLRSGHDFEVLPMTDEALRQRGGVVTDTLQFPANIREAAADALDHNRVMAYLDTGELNDNLKFIYRTSRTAMEENGHNSLFLALGVLKWYENDRSTVARYAPILMVPMQIVRHKANQYVIRATDEETIINVSLFEMVRQQFKLELPLLDPLPEDEHGVDVERILAVVRHCVKDMTRWNVLDECVLGLFSFNKFVMWKDIHDGSEALAKHPFITSLITGVPVEQGGEEEADGDIDSTYAPGQLALPVDIDSSQLEAVIESEKGRSFILHGPPGTGKSQTITNIIANALYHGRRVLFVAAKMAALEVVQKRLERIGLAPFCLEMYSNKSTKSHFLGQLKRALEVTRYTPPSEFQDQANRLLSARNVLAKYVDELYRQHENGFTLHDCIEGFLSHNEASLVTLPSDVVNALMPARLEELEQEVARIDTIIQFIGNPSLHPLMGLQLDDTAVSHLPELRQMLADTVAAADQLKGDQGFVTQLLAIPAANSLNSVTHLSALLDQLVSIDEITPSMENVILDSNHENRLRMLIDAGQRRDEAVTTLLRTYDRSVLQLDTNALRNRWNDIQQMWWLPRFFAKRRFVREMRIYNPSFTPEGLPQLLSLIDTFKQHDSVVRDGQATLLTDYGPLAQPGAENWQSIASQLNDGSRFREAITAYCRAMGCDVREVLNALAAHIRQSHSLMLQPHHHKFNDINANCRQLAQLLGRLHDEVAVHTDAIDSLDTLIDQCNRWMPAVQTQGGQWYHWCVGEQRLRKAGLDVIADLLLDGVSASQAANTLVKSAYKAMAEGFINQSVELQTFLGLQFESAIENFRSLDKEFQNLTMKELYCRLAAQVPVGAAAVAHGSEVGIAKRNIANGGRGTSIRRIIDQIPTLLPRLCPCMLMSPLSVAQFLAMDCEPFDLVIFDEASQLPTSEAVGTIARGKTVVVVGDPKQMPPTSFFNVSQVDEEEADIDDLDSVLDDAIALSLPSRYLTWHYRSKHESLIAFSNAQYYDGRLFTFPSVDDRVSRVTFVPIQGTYDKGHTRCNPAEAEAIVAELIRRIADRRHSVGVVAFSIPQQNLIEDKLLEALEKHPELEALARESEEPLFIKNLENVQGDERDVILFSVGYGPDSNGRVSMNFGPLNKTGGERRLNVAVSRARYEMMVFSTLMPEQIDLNRSKALGVYGLRQFLEYARDGRMSIEAGQISRGHTMLAQSIADALAAHGYVVKLGVGRSRFKIDVAVVDPRDSDRYLLGIVCDGPGYREARTVRDREVCRPAMLAALGWHVTHVWSLEWFMHSDDVLERLLKLIKALEAQTVEAENVGTHASSPLFQPGEAVAAPTIEDQSRPYPSVAYPTPERTGLLPMLDSKNVKMQIEQIKAIVNKEQPVTQALIARRMSDIWQISDAEGLRFVEKRVDALMKKCGLYADPVSMGKNPVFWTNQKVASKFGFKYRDGGGRLNNEIPPIEVANAIYACVKVEVSIPKEDLQRRITALFGFTRRTPKLNAAIDLAIAHLLYSNILVKDGDNYQLPPA